VTNLFDSAEFTGCYRVVNGVRNAERPIMKIVVDIGKGTSPELKLAAGTYWLAFSLDGSLISGPWGVPNILDTTYTAGTAIQRADGEWNIIKDGQTHVQSSIPLRLLAEEKQPQAAPPAPVVATLTDTSVTLEVIAGAEYRLIDGAWQTDPVFTGLTPNTTYRFYARLAATATHMASPESPATEATTLKSPQAAPPAPVVAALTDTSVTLEVIAGAEYRLNDGAWQTNPVFTGLTPNTTYKFYARLAETATHLASPESPATEATTLKIPQVAPPAPVVAALTDTSVTLEVIAGAEYRLNDGAWQTDPVFTGLTPNTTYKLYARLAETATHMASPESPATEATTLKSPQAAPDAPVVAALTDTSVTLEVIAGAEYRLNDGAWQTNPVFTGLTPNTTYKFYARLAETATHLASPESPATEATTLKIPQVAPPAPVVAALTDTSVTLEVITGAEYKLNDGAWQTDPVFTGLTPNTTYKLYARLAETATHMASPESPATEATTLKSSQTEPDETQPGDTIPKTGESSGHYPWLALLLISASGLIFLTRKKRISQQGD
jgi:LPXTG-motif cell wall-anchored protein